MIITSCTHRPVLVPCSLDNLDYQVDPYIGCEHYCYYCYVLKDAETDWTQEIRMHGDIAGQLRGELEKIPPQKIYMGYHTDPYQPCEAQYRQTRQVLELLSEKGCSASILTKSSLVVRDIDILKEMDDASVSVSVAFNDHRTRVLFEDNTIPTEERIEALAKVADAGIQTNALICPVIPYITDVIPLIDSLASLTNRIWIYGLSIEERSDPNWQNVKEILTRHYPEMHKTIEEVIFSKQHSYWTRLREELIEAQDSRKLNLSIHV